MHRTNSTVLGWRRFALKVAGVWLGASLVLVLESGQPQ
uniref:Uncharacterized protein n=1 Tax=Arundo donax TaxID=35708 RepID=A0A0A9C739_ARUDO